MDSGNNGFLELVSAISADVCRGLLYTHTRLNDNTKKIIESTSFLYALIELLSDKGIISIEDMDAKKRKVAERLVRKFTESGLGLMYQDPEVEKYAFEQETAVDCHTCLNTCKAICCKFPFALSRQDVEEGLIRWEFRRPYLIAHDSDGYCVHLDRETYQCSVHAYRPVPCRGFDCKNNNRWKVWKDNDRKYLNPELTDQIIKTNKTAYASNHPLP